MDYIIKLSSEDVTMDGKPIEDVKKEEITRQQMIDKDLSQDKIDFIKSKILTKRASEKSILLTLVGIGYKSEKDLGKYNKLLDLASQIDEAEDKVFVNNEDLTVIRKSFTDMASNKDLDRPVWWRNCIELFKQIESPEKIELKEETDSDQKPDGPKKEEPKK